MSLSVKKNYHVWGTTGNPVRAEKPSGALYPALFSDCFRGYRWNAALGRDQHTQLLLPLTCRFFGRTSHTNKFCLLTPPHPVPPRSSAWEWYGNSPFSPGLFYGPRGDWWRSGTGSCLPQKISTFITSAAVPRAGFSFHFSNSNGTISHWYLCLYRSFTPHWKQVETCSRGRAVTCRNPCGPWTHAGAWTACSAKPQAKLWGMASSSVHFRAKSWARFWWLTAGRVEGWLSYPVLIRMFSTTTKCFCCTVFNNTCQETFFSSFSFKHPSSDCSLALYTVKIFWSAWSVVLA